MKYALSVTSTRMSGLIQVCLSDIRTQRLNRLFALRRFELLPDLWLVGVSGGDGLSCEKSLVASAVAPVSPRGSPPKLELFRRRVPMRLELLIRVTGGGLDESGGKASVCWEDILVVRSD